MRSETQTLSCDRVSEALPRMVDGPSVADYELNAHVESCRRCQNELARYRRLLRSLRQLREQLLEPAPGLVADVLTSIGAERERRFIRSLVRRRWGAYVGGVAAATAAAGAASVLVLTHRARQRMRLVGSASWS